MNSLTKGMCVIASVLLPLWGGAQLLPKESHENQESSYSTQPETDKILNDFQQEIGVLRDRLTHVEDVQPNLKQLQGQLDQLEDNQQHLRAEIQALPPPSASLVREEEADGPALEHATSESEHEQKLFALYETRFLYEAEDPSWSQQAESSLKQAVTDSAFDGSYLLTTDCRSTLCQVEVGHESDGARDDFVNRFPFALPFDTEVFYYRLEDGKGMPYTVLYMARAGQQLPTLTP